MPRTSISRFREFVRTLNYFVSIHAAEALEDDKLTILDLENIILTGEVVERQRDRQSREAKFVIRGETREAHIAEAVVKIGPTGRLVVITAYLV